MLYLPIYIYAKFIYLNILSTVCIIIFIKKLYDIQRMKFKLQVHSTILKLCSHIPEVVDKSDVR